MPPVKDQLKQPTFVAADLQRYCPTAQENGPPAGRPSFAIENSRQDDLTLPWR
jgi:hypothetical protein